MSYYNLNINQSRAVNDLSKYIVGVSINQNGEPSGIASGMAFMGAISGGGWAIKNRKNIKGGIIELAANAKTQKDIVNSGKVVSEGSSFNRFRNKLAGAGEYISKTELEALSQKYAKKPEYSRLKNYIDEALKTGKDYTKTLKEVEKLKAIENLNKYNAKVAAQTANGNIFRKFKNTTKLTNLSKATKELAVKSGKFRGLLKGVKGNAAFAIFSLGAGILCDVVPAFKLGKDKGFKQLGKTVIKTGAEVAGWAAGAAAGAKLGAVVGSFCGPVGTLVGGAIGLIGGFVGSFLASKAADKIVGPSEVEIAQAEAAKEIAQQAQADPDTLDELSKTSYNQLLEKAQNGTLTEDDLKAKKALESLIGTEINLDEEVKKHKQETAAQDTTSLTMTQAEKDLLFRQLYEKNKAEEEKLLNEQEKELQLSKSGVSTANPYTNCNSSPYAFGGYNNNLYSTYHSPYSLGGNYGYSPYYSSYLNGNQSLYSNPYSAYSQTPIGSNNTYNPFGNYQSEQYFKYYNR